LDGRRGERIVGRRCRDSGQEAGLDVDQLSARPPLRLASESGHCDDEVGAEDPAGDPLDRFDRRAGALASGDGADQIGFGERRRRRRKLAAHEVGDPLVGVDEALHVLGSAVPVEHDVLEPPAPLDGVAGPLLRPADEPFGGVGTPPGLLGLGLPCCIEPLTFHFGLVTPGGQHRRLPTLACVGCAPRRQPGVNFTGALREPVEQRLGDAGDLRDVPARPPFHPQRRRQLVAELGLEHLAGGSGVAVEVLPVQGAPPPIGSLRHVGHQHMPVQERIPGPRRPMAE
jgi:hypothetical protein